MAQLKPAAKPTFLRQGFLILLPVIALALFGAWSIWQDRRMAQAEAFQRANELADSLMFSIQQQSGYASLQANPLISNPDRLEGEVRRFLDSPAQPEGDPVFRWSNPLREREHCQLAILNQRDEL